MAQSKKKNGFWFLFLFALPFAGVGVGILTFSIIPSLYEWQSMKQWTPIKAKLQSADLKVSHGDDSTTYRAIASYRYQYDHQTYFGDRVGIMSGSDNVGSWQQDKARALESAHRNERDITIYVNPKDPTQSVIYPELRTGMLGFKFIFTIIFGGVGIGLIIAALYSRKKAKLMQANKHLPLWQQEPDWANPISSGNRAGLIAIGFFAFVWNAISSIVLFVIPDELAKGNHAVLIALIFPIFGIGLIIFFIVHFLRWRRFGNIALTLNPWPGAIGGQVGGEVQLPISYSDKPKIKVTITCYYCKYEGSGDDRKMTESIHWQNEGFAEIAPAPHGSYARFKFDVPSDLPSSQIADDNYYKWTVDLSADLPGADLKANYDIPVFATGEKSIISTKTSDSHPEFTEQYEQQFSTLANIQQLPDGVSLDFGYFRRLGSSIGGVLFGAIFSGAGIAMGHSDAPFFMAAIFTLIGSLVLLGALYSMLNRYHVKVGARGIYTERYIAGILVNKRYVAPERIKYLTLEKNGSAQSGSKHTEYFVISAITRDGSKIRVAESLSGRIPSKQALEKIAELSGFAKG